MYDYVPTLQIFMKENQKSIELRLLKTAVRCKTTNKFDLA